VELTIANQTDEPHPIIITGGSRETRVAAVPPTAAATIQRTFEPGEYEIRAGSEAAVEREIKPAILTVGPERESASGELSLP
jgi:hypothetical protein